MKERWLPVVNWEGLYEVSDNGRVRSCVKDKSKRGPHGGKIKILSEATNKYLMTMLYNGNYKTFKLVHRMVLEAFVGPCPKGMESRHYPDRTRTNCNLNNLSWATRSVNMLDKREHGTIPDHKGERHPNAKLNNTDVERIFDLRRNGRKQQEIADWIGCSVANICMILSGKSWPHYLMATKE